MVAIFLYNSLGIHGVLFLDGLSFLMGASLIFFIVPINEEVVTKERMTISIILTDLKIGFKYIYSHKKIFMIIILSAFVNFFLAAYNLLLPYSNQMFGEISDGLYGVFLTAEAIGGFIGAILSGVKNKTLSSKRLMVFLSCSGLMLMLSTPLYFLFQNFIILAFSPALFSLFLSIFNIQFFSIVQRDVDNEFLGRNLSSLIVKGTISLELIKPYSVVLSLISQDIGKKIFDLLKCGVASLVFINGLNVDLTYYNFNILVIFIFQVLLGIFIVQLMDLIFGLLAFYTVNTWGILILRNSIFSMTSGVLLPLRFYPQNIRELMSYSPYSYAINTPIEYFFNGKLETKTILAQLIWLVTLCIVVKMIWKSNRQLNSINGG